MDNKFNFSEKDKNRISDAVKELESVSSGELVIYHENRSDDYKEGAWFCATLFALLGTLLAAFLSYFWMIPKGMTIFEISIYQIILIGFGYLAARLFPVVRLSFINDSVVEDRVRRRALEMFTSEEVFNTRDRTGILLFISRLEHKVVVLGDSGINAKVSKEDWQAVIDLVLGGIRKGNTTEGIVQAVNKCRDLLVLHQFKRREDDTNELSDEMRLGS